MIKHRYAIHDDAIVSAAHYSSMMPDYMLRDKIYSNEIHLSNDLISDALENASVNLVHKNIIVLRYLSNMKDKVSIDIDAYKKWIGNLLCNIMMRGTMDGYFQMFKEILPILLQKEKQGHDWKCFTKSKIIDKKLLI